VDGTVSGSYLRDLGATGIGPSVSTTTNVLQGYHLQTIVKKT
jgi:hypothetical protein